MTPPTVLEIDHFTRYGYSAPASECVMRLCLKPRGDRGQQLLDFDIATRPRCRLVADTDCFGNDRQMLSIHEEHRHLDIQARSVVMPGPDPVLPDRLPDESWQALHATCDPFHDWAYLHPSALTTPSAALEDFIAGHGIDRGDDPLQGIRRLSRRLHRLLAYVPGATSTQSTIDDVLATGAGVCQDYAHLLIAIARSWRIPSRYVSGFLRPGDDPDVVSPSSATHAWAECRLPGLGWIGLDPTNNCVAGSSHIRIATGRDYFDVPPTRGIVKGGGDATLEVVAEIRAR